MAKAIVALYGGADVAHRVIRELTGAGFAAKQISLIAHDPTGEHARRLGLGPGPGPDVHPIEGAALGGLAGLLVGLALVAVPGIGPIIAAGPLAAALGGAGVGVTMGGILGALSDLGVPEDETPFYEAALRRGDVLVAVISDDSDADRAARIMRRFAPLDAHREAGLAARARAVEGPAPNNGRPGATAGGYDDATIGEGLYRRGAEEGPGGREPAFRFGSDLADRARHAGLDWPQAEAEARAEWEQGHPGTAWSEVRSAVCRGYAAARGKEPATECR